jgi:DNA helicase-2/ATP-dependent DNA helicase PcrA
LLPPFEDDGDEAAGVATDIKELHSHELDAIVVIARNRRLLSGVERALRSEGLSAVIAQRKDEFESAPMKWLHSVLRLASDRQDRQILEAVCGTFKQLTGSDIDDTEVVAEADASGQGFFRRWIKRAERLPLDEETRKVISLASLNLGGGSDFLRFSETALLWFDHISVQAGADRQDSGEETFALYAEEREVWCELVREIIGVLGSDPSLEAFLQELQMRSKESLPGRNVVRLFTIHASKGKEFEHVYLVGLVEDELPSFQSIKRGDKSPEMEEERRNCFVAITRTSKTLTLSYAHKYRGWPKTPSRFLSEMGFN